MSVNPLSSTSSVALPTQAASATQDPQQLSIAAKAQEALAKGVNDGGPVNDVKTYSDQSGKTGDNDYFSALGYDA